MTDHQPPTIPDFYWQVRHYEHADGRTLVERIPTGDVPDDFPRFVGMGEVQVPLPTALGGPDRVASREFEFVIPEATTVAEAFERWQAGYDWTAPGYKRQIQQEIDAKIDQMKQMQQESRRPKLVGPGGLRLNR